MPESPLPKIPQSPSPEARAGAGDISEIELSRERHNLQTTPQMRVQPAHPKKQLFSVPVSKFTGKPSAPSPNLVRLRSCLDAYANATPSRPARPRARPKAVSMEDLTPTKKIKIQRKQKELPVARSPVVHTALEEQAAAKVARFMLVCAWRRRRGEVRCLRRTLECQVSCSERLRIQVSALKSLLEGDNCKLRLAMRELERLKQLLRDKDIQKALLEREKVALERDVCAAEDQASEMSIGWRNCRNELEGARAAGAACEHALALERAAAAEARAQRDHAYHRLSMMEEELAQHEALLSEAEAEVVALRHEAGERARQLDDACDQLHVEKEARSLCAQECASLNERVAAAARDSRALRATVEQLRDQLGALAAQLRLTQEQLDWWPAPLTRMAGAARWLLRRPLRLRLLRLPSAALWALLPARHGC